MKDDSHTKAGGIVAIVISYRDTDALRLTTQAINQQVDRVVVVDNDSGYEFRRALSEIEEFPRVELIRLTRNEGIAKALNIGVQVARTYNPSWILTLDQDSVADMGMVKGLLETTEFAKGVGVVAASPDESRMCKPPTYPLVVITSGNLVKAEVFDTISYNDEYFIDSVDFDFCLKAKKSGWTIIQSNSVFLKHRLGQANKVKLLGMNFVYVSHSPLRRYYIFRNHIFLIKDYFSDFPFFLMKKSLFLLKIFLAIILFDKQKSENLKMIVKGLYEGIISKNRHH